MIMPSVLFLAWGPPWPAISGGQLRTLSLLRELSKIFRIELVILTRQFLSEEQIDFFKCFTSNILEIPLCDISVLDRLAIVRIMFRKKIPYHSAAVLRSFAKCPGAVSKVLNFKGLVYACGGHWGIIFRMKKSAHVFIDQFDQDIDFWRVYALHVKNPIKKVFVLFNYKFSLQYYKKLYPSIAGIISVCEEDKEFTLKVEPSAKVYVIENGVDCSFFSPQQKTNHSHCLLFTGTSVPRNVSALMNFVQNIFPFIQENILDVELLVAGNFSIKVQRQFQNYKNIRFTGRVDDIRPFFNQSDIFIAPFWATHGSKLKISEAMAMAMCIVSTPEGVRGFVLKNEESVVLAANDLGFAEKIISLFSNPQKINKIGNAAREIALQRYDWKILGERLVNILITEARRIKSIES